MVTSVAIGADHRGYPVKEALKAFLNRQGIAVTDMGTSSEEPVDYPQFAAAVARAVASGDCERGILVCGSGIGMSVAANKFQGIRAALCRDVNSAEMSRQHNNSNILVMAAQGGAEQAQAITSAWIKTPFEGGRHQKRLDQIRAIEQANFRQE
jgi:ribose 5-phosphate isomerase B